MALYISYREITNPYAPSDVLTVVDNDTTLADYDTDPEESQVVNLGPTTKFVLLVDAVPEAAQKIKLRVLSRPAEDSAQNYEPWNGNKTPADEDVPLEFTEEHHLEIGPFDNTTGFSVIEYGYSGGTGAGASLTVKVVGKRVA